MMKVVGVALALMTLALWFLWNANEKKAEELGIVNAALVGAEATIAYKDKTAAASQAFADQLATLRATSKRQMEGIKNERDRMRVTAEKRALENPYDFGNQFEFDLARVFCLFEASTNRDARKACDLHSREDYDPDIALTLTVTPKFAERRKEECEAARDREEEGSDFCRWAITGFTTNGKDIFLDHFERLAGYTLAVEDRAEILEKMLRALMKPDEPAEN